MADTIGRVIKRAPAGGGSTSDLFAAYRALGSGTFQTWMTSDLNHLGDESTYRTLRSVPGFASVDQPSPTTPAINAELTIGDFDWSSSVLSPLPANVCLGTHVIHRSAIAASAWPNIVLRARIETLATSPFADYVGAILVCCPGRWRAPQDGDLYAWDVIPANGGAWEDLVLTIPMSGEAALTDASFEQVTEYPMLGDGGASGVPVIGEPINVFVATFWCAFYTNAGKSQVLGITLATEPE